MSIGRMSGRAAGFLALASLFPIMALFALLEEESRTAQILRYLTIALPMHAIIVAASVLARARVQRLRSDSSRLSRDDAVRWHRRMRRLDAYLAGPAMLFGCGGALFMASGTCVFAAFASPTSLLVLHTVAVIGYSLNTFAKDSMVYFRRCAAGTLEQVLASGKSPVLYLRSFGDDDEAQQRPNSYQTEEEEVADALESFGPLVAIGEPGEELPDLGAARGQFEDGEWQDAIRDLMGRSIVVVIRAGSTPGLLWEVKQTVALVDARRLVFLIPDDEENYRSFFDLVSGDLPRGLPVAATLFPGDTDEEEQQIRSSLGTLRGIIHFDQNWEPRFRLIEARPGITIRYLTIGLHRALRPVHENLGLKWRERHTSPFMIGNWMSIGRGAGDP